MPGCLGTFGTLSLGDLERKTIVQTMIVDFDHTRSVFQFQHGETNVRNTDQALFLDRGQQIVSRHVVLTPLHSVDGAFPDQQN